MCKFASRGDPGYKKVLRIIRAFVQEVRPGPCAATDEEAVKFGA